MRDELREARHCERRDVRKHQAVRAGECQALGLIVLQAIAAVDVDGHSETP
jgi:hypothetical protein